MATPRNMVRETRSNRITIPLSMVRWKAPLVYEVVSVERNQNEVVIRLRVIMEGGEEQASQTN